MTRLSSDQWPARTQPKAGGLRRRADKLRIIGWTNLLGCIAIGLFLDFGTSGSRWSAAMAWAVLLLIVCSVRATKLDKQGPRQRR